MSLEVLLKKIGGQVIEIILINESHWSGLTIQVANSGVVYDNLHISVPQVW